MTDRERLIDLIEKTFAEQYEKRGLLTAQHTAADLLANGVIVPPCKVGDKIWLIRRNRETLEWYICEEEVCSISVYKESTHIYVTPIVSFVEEEIGVRVFLTKEEAEAKLKELRK